MSFDRINVSPLHQSYQEDPARAKSELTHALRAAQGSVLHAAKAMNMSKPGVWYYLRALGMNDVPRQIRESMKYRKRLPPLADFEKHVKRAL